jgi:hypothetical protein
MSTYTLTEEQIRFIYLELIPVMRHVGPYTQNPQEFAWSVMNESSAHANAVLYLLDKMMKDAGTAEGLGVFIPKPPTVKEAKP